MKRRNYKGRGKIHKNNYIFEINKICSNNDKYKKLDYYDIELLYIKKIKFYPF